jgi:hypothetical protein
LRTHPSPVPGILLTHENGQITGGPGPTPTAINEFVQNIMAKYADNTAEEFEKLKERLMSEAMEEIKKRAAAREDAIRHNSEIDKQIRDLEAQREAERRVAERLKQRRR